MCEWNENEKQTPNINKQKSKAINNKLTKSKATGPSHRALGTEEEKDTERKKRKKKKKERKKERKKKTKKARTREIFFKKKNKANP